MDVNGTRFQLLLSEDDWAACNDGHVSLRAPDDPAQDEQPADLVWSRERGELTLRPLLFQFKKPTKDRPPSLSERRGAARDRYGNWYWIDDEALRICVTREEDSAVSIFWQADEEAAPPSGADGGFAPREVNLPKPMRLSGLAVTADQYLVVGVLEPKGLLVFDLYADNSPLRILWPATVPFAPFDMAAPASGGLFILDRDNKRLWELDRHLNVCGQGQEQTTLDGGPRDDFQPQGGGPERRTQARTFPSGISLDDSSPLTLADPVSVEALPDGTALVLDRDSGSRFSFIYRYRAGRQSGKPISTGRMEQLVRPEERSTFRLSGFDFAFAHAETAGDKLTAADRLYVADDDGNQAFAFSLSETGEGQFELEPLPDYLPMRQFGGKGVVSVGADTFYDFGDGWIPLVEQKRPRYLQTATLYTPVNPDDTETDAQVPAESQPAHAFDGREPDCVWHRLLLDACIPPETEVLVESRAANDERELSFARWMPEPGLYQRGGGSELPFASRRATLAGASTWELLFQQARGRYLQLRLTLNGNGRTTPRIHALRAYYPRFSYLEHYVPALYREDERSASFLDRFLSNFEGLYTSMEDAIASVQVLFDVRSAPSDALEWLAGWLGVALDPTWDEARRRLFIKHAPTFFQWRGTTRGLQMALRLALDECADEAIFADQPCARCTGAIRIIEKFRTRLLPAAVLGDPTGGGSVPLVTVSPQPRWQPGQGIAVLNKLYNDFLTGAPAQQTTTGAAATQATVAAIIQAAAVFAATGQATNSTQPVQYTLTPTDEERDLWEQFSQAVLGFVPTSTTDETLRWQDFLKRRHVTAEQLRIDYGASTAQPFSEIPLPFDLPRTPARLEDWLKFIADTDAEADALARRQWQEFLARRYHRVAKLNEAHGTRWSSFGVVSLPASLPSDAAPLQDWFQFEGVLLPMHSVAHRFTVLLPVRSSGGDAEEDLQRSDLARRIVELEKPAHTSFDMKFYWEWFRIGSARLGEDTLIDLGSRAPQLMTQMILGRGHLAESFLGAITQVPADRQVLGREPLAE